MAGRSRPGSWFVSSWCLSLSRLDLDDPLRDFGADFMTRLLCPFLLVRFRADAWPVSQGLCWPSAKLGSTAEAASTSQSHGCGAASAGTSFIPRGEPQAQRRRSSDALESVLDVVLLPRGTAKPVAGGRGGEARSRSTGPDRSGASTNPRENCGFLRRLHWFLFRAVRSAVSAVPVSG